MGITKAKADLSSENIVPSSESDNSLSSFIPIRHGRKQSLFLHTIHYLAHQRDNLGNVFQPCLEDLVYLFGGSAKHTDQVIKVLKRKGLLERVHVDLESRSKYLPDLLLLSSKGTDFLCNNQNKNPHRYPEWQRVSPRIKRLLQDPQVQFLDQHKGTFYQVREIIRFTVPFLPITLLIDNKTITRIAASNKSKPLSLNELCHRILGLLDVLLRIQGEYLSYEAMRKINSALNNRGLRVTLSKRKLHPHIQNAASFFGTDQSLERKNKFYNAVTKALNCYCEKYSINNQAKTQIFDVNNRLRRAGRISLDPEARALGIIGYVIDGFFLHPNREEFPLPPEMGLMGRDQMHQIRKLFRKLAL
ncbi:MAG: hypothetical protein ACXAEL_08450 [Candidatus Hodarchaeales archaeon]